MLKRPDELEQPAPMNAFLDKRAKPGWLLASQLVDGFFSTVRTCVVALRWPLGVVLASAFGGPPALEALKHFAPQQHVQQPKVSPSETTSTVVSKANSTP